MLIVLLVRHHFYLSRTSGQSIISIPDKCLAHKSIRSIHSGIFIFPLDIKVDEQHKSLHRGNLSLGEIIYDDEWKQDHSEPAIETPQISHNQLTQQYVKIKYCCQVCGKSLIL